MKSLLSKAKVIGDSPHFVLMLYRNTPLSNGLQLPMELLCARQARFNLPLSHWARMQVGQTASIRPQFKAVRPTNTNQVGTSNSLLIGAHMVYKTPCSKMWHPGILKILQDRGSYIITASDGATY